MKKILAITLVGMMLLSMLALPAMATENVDKTAAGVFGKLVTLDGVKDDTVEGWSSTPVAYLNKTYGLSDGTENSVDRGEVYVAADLEYVYIFVKIYSDYNVSTDSAYTQTFIKAYFGSIGEEEIGFWGTNKGNTRSNPSVKYTENWPSGVIVKAEGKALNNNSDGTYTIECRLPVPPSVRTAMKTTGYDIKISVCQGLLTYGAYVSDSAIPSNGGADDARNAKDYGLTVTLPAHPDHAIEDQSPALADISGADIEIDGIDNEGWAALDYTLISTYTSFGNTVATESENPSKIRFASDGQYLYIYYEATDRSHFGTNPILYIYTNFASEGSTKKTAPYLKKTVDDSFLYNDTEGAKSAVVVGENVTTAEIRIPIPETERTAIKSTGTTFNIGIWERYTNGGEPATGDAGMTFWSYWSAAYTILVPKIDHIADNESRYVGAQARVNPDNSELRDVRFVAAISDYRDYEELGFDMMYDGNPGVGNCYTVYSSLIANGETVYADTYGGKYFFAFTITGLAKGNSYTFDVTSFTKKADANKVSGTTKTVTVTVSESGDVTIS